MDMTGMLVEIFKKNKPLKLPIWVWHRHILTPKSYERNSRKQVIATCGETEISVLCVL